MRTSPRGMAMLNLRADGLGAASHYAPLRVRDLAAPLRRTDRRYPTERDSCLESASGIVFGVTRWHDASWLKDWRVRALAVGCLSTGFLVGLFVFGSPWHLPPDWGDIPTWLLVVVGAAAGGIGLFQFRLLVQQNEEEIRRNVKRDELLDRQLAEAEARAITERRRQAEGVQLRWGNIHTGEVANNSQRPISSISCRVISTIDGSIRALPDRCGLVIAVPLPAERSMSIIEDSQALGQWERLRAAGRCSFTFESILHREPGQLLVAWFTDDAGFRWQLDEYSHLVQASDKDEYLT
jgi:hypothetical protein